MSLVLTDAGEKLEITAASTIPFTVHYADYVGATPVFTPGVAGDDTIVGTKDLLAAPGSGQRVVRTITVFNDSGGADTITIQLDDGGVNYTIVTAALPDDHALYYDEDGWKVLDDTGSILTSLVGNTTQHNILSSSHADAATDAVTRGSIIVGNATPAWDELAHPGTTYHLQTDPTDVVWSQNITMADDAWIGIGAALERINFDTTGYVAVMGANLGVGTLTPFLQLGVQGGVGVYVGNFYSPSDGFGTTFGRRSALATGCAVHIAAHDATGYGFIQAYNYDGAGAVIPLILNLGGGNVGVGVNPAFAFDILKNAPATFVFQAINSGAAVGDHALLLQAGGAGAAVGTTYYLYARDSAAAVTGWVGTVNGVFQLLDVSDESRKANIVDTKINGLDIINSLRVRDYNWEANPDSPMMTSFIAQEAQKVFPAMVSEALDGTLGTSRAMLIPVLTKAVQELDARLTRGGL